MLIPEQNMFKNKTAWFSKTVKMDISSFWVSQGGIISNWRTADYLFSDDASCPDTKRIHLSDDNAMGRATVFHSSFLATCKVRQSAQHVPLGCYLLPPVSVQKEVKALFGRFIWEQDEPPEETPLHGSGSAGRKFSVPAEDGGSRPEKRKLSQKWAQTSPSRHELQFYPENDMVSGYKHIDQLKKYSGELHDLFPSKSGGTISKSRRHTGSHKEG